MKYKVVRIDNDGPRFGGMNWAVQDIATGTVLAMTAGLITANQICQLFEGVELVINIQGGIVQDCQCPLQNITPVIVDWEVDSFDPSHDTRTSVWGICSDEEKDEESGEALWWSNGDGWVHKSTATEFSEEDHLSFNTIPGPSHWERLDDDLHAWVYALEPVKEYSEGCACRRIVAAYHREQQNGGDSS